MLDDDDGVARLHQLVQHLQQQINVGEMQAGGGLVQDVERATSVSARQLQGQFHALRLAATQGGGRLAQSDVTQAHFHQGLQLACQVGHRAKKRQGVFHRHVQYVRDVFALVLHLQGFAVVALAVTNIARHIDIGQEVHFHFHHAVALAGGATTTFHVEGKTPRAIAAFAGHRHLGHQLAQGREQAGVSGRVGTRRAANRGLVHVDDFVEVVQPQDVVMRCGFFMGAVNLPRRSSVQGVVHQSGFARARHARDTGEQAHREFSVHVLQVVATCTQNGQGLLGAV